MGLFTQNFGCNKFSIFEWITHKSKNVFILANEALNTCTQQDFIVWAFKPEPTVTKIYYSSRLKKNEFLALNIMSIYSRNKCTTN